MSPFIMHIKFNPPVLSRAPVPPSSVLGVPIWSPLVQYFVGGERGILPEYGGEDLKLSLLLTRNFKKASVMAMASISGDFPGF